MRYNKAMETLKWLTDYLEKIEYFSNYPSRQYIQQALNDESQTVDYKIKLIVGDGLVQSHLYGDVLSSIDMSADPLEYFYSHVKMDGNDA